MVKQFTIISKEKISNQLGDGHLLQQLTNKKIVYNFRKNDILNVWRGRTSYTYFS